MSMRPTSPSNTHKTRWPLLNTHLSPSSQRTCLNSSVDWQIFISSSFLLSRYHHFLIWFYLLLTLYAKYTRMQLSCYVLLNEFNLSPKKYHLQTLWSILIIIIPADSWRVSYWKMEYAWSPPLCIICNCCQGGLWRHCISLFSLIMIVYILCLIHHSIY